MGVDVGGAIQHTHNIDAMTMLDKARAIQYALSKAKKLELPAPTEPKELNPRPTPTLASTVTKLLSPTPTPPAELDPDERVSKGGSATLPCTTRPTSTAPWGRRA
jgi:hypothetical protein